MPGHESRIRAQARLGAPLSGSGRLKGKVALVTGADSGIGRAVAARTPGRAPTSPSPICASMTTPPGPGRVEAEGRKAIAIAGDLGDRAFCAAS